MLNVKIDKGDPTDLYEQVAGEIRRAIADGEAKPGERLPPAKDLAAVLGVNTNTVLRSLRLLRDEGLLEFRRGRGISVAGTPERGAVVQRARELVEFARCRVIAWTSWSRSSKTSADEDRRRSRGAARLRREQLPTTGALNYRVVFIPDWFSSDSTPAQDRFCRQNTFCCLVFSDPLRAMH